MAKSSRVVVSSSAGKAAEANRGLFTAAERQLLASSEASGLARSTPAQVQALLARARLLRDKWRDLLAQQSRVQKRVTPAVAQANARSRAKAELFDGAVKRLESHVASLANTEKGLLPTGAPPAARRTAPTKKSRVVGHRRSRAGVRAELTEHTRRLNELATKPPVTKPPVTRPLAARSAAAKKMPALQPTAQPAPAPAAAPANLGKKAAKGAKRMGAKKPVVASAQAIRIDRTKQRAAKAAAKKARLTVGGRTTRLSGHLLASGKRSQARRDKRGR